MHCLNMRWNHQLLAILVGGLSTGHISAGLSYRLYETSTFCNHTTYSSSTPAEIRQEMLRSLADECFMSDCCEIAQDSGNRTILSAQYARRCSGTDGSCVWPVRFSKLMRFSRFTINRQIYGELCNLSGYSTVWSCGTKVHPNPPNRFHCGQLRNQTAVSGYWS